MDQVDQGDLVDHEDLVISLMLLLLLEEVEMLVEGLILFVCLYQKSL